MIAPELKELQTKLQAEKDALVKKLAPTRAEYDDLRNKMAPFEKRLSELKIIIKANNPRLAELDSTLSKLAVAAGGKKIELETGIFN